MKVGQRILESFDISQMQLTISASSDWSRSEYFAASSLRFVTQSCLLLFLHCTVMNSSVSKRKRFQFIEEDEHDSSTEELLKIASNFVNSADADTSRWLKSAATKALAINATKDMILLYPSSKWDEGETVNDNWALTSNWVFYTLQPVLDDLTPIKVGGTMFPSEEDMHVQKSVKVQLPEYLLQAKNKVEVQGRKLILDDGTQLREGEEEQSNKARITVSLYGIRDLDNNPRTCSLKSEGVKRMVKVAGMIRLMGIERFERLVIDLHYCRKNIQGDCPALRSIIIYITGEVNI